MGPHGVWVLVSVLGFTFGVLLVCVLPRVVGWGAVFFLKSQGYVDVALDVEELGLTRTRVTEVSLQKGAVAVRVGELRGDYEGGARPLFGRRAALTADRAFISVDLDRPIPKLATRPRNGKGQTRISAVNVPAARVVVHRGAEPQRSLLLGGSVDFPATTEGVSEVRVRWFGADDQGNAHVLAQTASRTAFAYVTANANNPAEWARVAVGERAEKFETMLDVPAISAEAGVLVQDGALSRLLGLVEGSPSANREAGLERGV